MDKSEGLNPEKQSVERKRIQKLFARYDLDNSGTINSNDERQQLVTGLLMAEQREYQLKGKTFTFRKKSLLSLIDQELANFEPITEANQMDINQFTEWYLDFRGRYLVDADKL